MSNLRLLLLFLILTLGGGMVIGLTNTPGEWYQALAKPPFNPPDWVFGPAWTILYILVAIAGARTFARGGAASAPMVAWWIQLALNFAWTPVFFTLQRPDLALPVIAPFFLAILVFIALSWRRDRLSAILFVPYLAWVGLASVLNFEIWRLN
ncbi:TspO/MBR family protein [Pararhizobium haloflavum]|uniref:TspO/MBR family protein n=1 Tax=Pararhizobium haloflavum TaxID=2037914 RepID=UPI000C177939|nr:TspO/MBR family protein [Pararhizobium haloflavum]